MRSFIVKGLLPWLLLFAFFDGSYAGMRFGVYGSLGCLLILNYRALLRKFIFDWATLLYLVFLLIVGVVMQQPYLINHGLLISYYALAFLCFLTILVLKPFALTYARTQIDEMYWNNPILKRVCYRITFLWGVVFLLASVSVGLFSYGTGSRLWMIEIIPTALVVLGIGVTILFPDAYRNWKLKQGGVAAIPGLSDIKQVVLGSVQIGYRTLGQGPLLILLHGSHMNMHYWDPDFLKKLGEHFQVLIFDYPGIGHSTYENMPFTLEKIASCLNRMIDKLELKPVAVVGYSMGGKLAQTFAVDYPDKIKSLILISTDFGGKQSVHADKHVFERLSDKTGTPEGQGRRFISLLFPDTIVPRFEKKMNQIIQSANLEGVVSQNMLEKENRLRTMWYEDDHNCAALKKVFMPTLIMMGEQDLLIPAKNAALMKEVMPHAEVVSYDDAGHGVIYQYPLDTADQITAFLGKINIC